MLSSVEVFRPNFEVCEFSVFYKVLLIGVEATLVANGRGKTALALGSLACGVLRVN